MPVRKTTRRLPITKVKDAILNTPIKSVAQSISSKIMYVVLLVAFLVIGYLIGKVEALQNGIGTGASVETNNTAQNDTNNAPQQPPAPVISLDAVKKVFDGSVIKFGKSNNKNVVIEAADPSCPYCHVAAGKNPELSKQMGPQFTTVDEGGTYVPPVIELKKLLDEGKISYAFVYTPGHGNGEMGTKAMYCAYDNDRFWEVHDLLYTKSGYDLLNDVIKNDKTKSGELADFLASAIDPTVMKNCLDSGKYDTRPSDDTSLLSSNLGSTGTPTYYINDVQKVGALSFTDMKSAIK